MRWHGEANLGLKRGADQLFLTGVLEGLQDFFADGEKVLPFGAECAERSWISNAAGDFGISREEREVNAFRATVDGGQMTPNFIGEETRDGSDEANHGFADAPDGSLRGAAAARVGSEGIEAVL